MSDGDVMAGAQAEPSAGPSSASAKPKLTVRGAVFLGVGAMVGAGIFALLGEAGAVAGSAVWISFLVPLGLRPALGG
jgi:amino acid transporter